MSNKSDIIYRKLMLAHSLFSNEELLNYILQVEKLRKQGETLTLLELLVRNNKITPDIALILRSEHDKVIEKVKERTSFKKNEKQESTKTFEKTVSDTVDNENSKNNQRTKVLQNDKSKKYKAKKSAINVGNNVAESNSITDSVKGKTTPISTRTPFVDLESKISAKASDANIDYMLGKTLGGCKLLQKIGEGGMGSVYKAYHIGLDKLVALKILPLHMTSSRERITRFHQEAKAAAKMEHPNIVQILNIGEEDKIHFIVMQYIDGEDLRRRLGRLGVFSPIEAIDITIQIASGLSMAHKKGIVHRDIKPDNIMFDKDGNAKITDFGLARQQEANLDISKGGKALGTPYYMSPEQCSGADIDGRSDIYSLGITLYHILTGKRPFKGTNPVATALMHIREPVTPPEKINPEIPLPLSDVVLKTLEKNPDNRYQDCDELITAIEYTRDQILNSKELASLTADAADKNALTQKSSIASKSHSFQENLKFKILMFAGIGTICMVLAVLLMIAIFSDNSDPTNNDKPIIPPPKKANAKTNLNPSEQKAQFIWESNIKIIEERISALMFTSAFQIIDDFLEDYKDTKTGKEALEYKSELQIKFNKKVDAHFKEIKDKVNRHINAEEFDKARDALGLLDPRISTDETKTKVESLKNRINKKATKKCTDLIDSARDFLAQDPPLVFRALGDLEEAIKINIPDVIEDAQKLQSKILSDIFKYNQEVNQKFLTDYRASRQYYILLSETLEALNKQNPYPLETGQAYRTFKAIVDNKTETNLLYQTYLEIFDDLTAIMKLWENIYERFNSLKDRETLYEFYLQNPSEKYKAVVIEVNENYVILKTELDEEITLSWQRFTPAFIADESFNMTKLAYPKALPLFLFGVSKKDEAFEYLDMISSNKKEKIAWRFNRLHDKWFDIYQAELLGIVGYYQLIFSKKKEDVSAAAIQITQAQSINEFSGWANIAHAFLVKAVLNSQAAKDKTVFYKKMYESLSKVPESFQDLKLYLTLFIEAATENNKNNEALSAARTIVKLYPKDPNSYLLRGRTFLNNFNKYSAKVDFTQALKLAPYNREIYDELVNLGQ